MPRAKLSVAASGALERGTARAVEIDAGQDGRIKIVDRRQSSLERQRCRLAVARSVCWSIRSRILSVSRFEISGPFRPAVMPWLYIEALTGAGVRMSDWDVVQSPLYRFGVGAVRKSPGGRVKWNFRGRGFRLWSPQGPQFGRCELLIDGRKAAELDFHADRQQPSQIVYTCDDAGDGYHAVVLRSITGRLAVDSLDVVN